MPAVRKGHTKSRHGCGNCKARRVKCGEEKPRCKKCTTQHLICNYTSTTSQLAIPGIGTFQLKSQQQPKPVEPLRGLNALIASMNNAPLHLHLDLGVKGPAICYLDASHVELLRKFHQRSVLTIGTAASAHVYQEVFTRMASEYSFVLHSILRFTLMHDRYIYDPLGTPASTAEVFHAYHAAALFSDVLSAPSPSNREKDALWATSALQGACAFAAIEATCAEEAWPLNSTEFTDLQWLKLSSGKRAVWQMADPTRRDSAFREVRKIEDRHRDEVLAKARSGALQSSHPDLRRLYNLESTKAEPCPYASAVLLIESLMPVECSHMTILWFLSFIMELESGFAQLVEEKDPPALLLLSWWYAKILQYNSWWMSRRALFECQAICIYVDRVLEPQHELRAMLDFPRSVCRSVVR